MRTKINVYLKRFIAACLMLALLLSLGAVPGTVANAAENSFQKTKVPLNSNVVDDKSLVLYEKDDVYYITIEDLCRLTRSSWEMAGSVIYVTNGIWGAEFDTRNQTFSDGYQKVNVSILEVSQNKYAVEAILFLNYFKALVLISDDTLYCTMPEFTGWEALAVDVEDTLMDIYQLYGGEGSVTFALTLDIIVDLMMGDLSTQEGYLKDAFMEALEVDLNDYEVVGEYKETSQGKLYEYLNSKKGKEIIDALDELMPIAEEPTKYFVSHHFNLLQKPVSDFLYNAKVAGEQIVARQYEKQLFEIVENKKRANDATGLLFDGADYVLLFASVIADTAWQVDYIKATDSLVYNVMGQENMDYLGISADDNDWFTIANQYDNVVEIASSELDEEIKKFYTNEIWWKLVEEANVSSAVGLSDGATMFSVLLAQAIIKHVPFSKQWVDAFESDRKAIYLAELQSNVNWVAKSTFQALSSQRDSLELYQKYIQALQLYCRTSIAMYKNLQVMVDEFELGRRDYWINQFQEKIDKLAISLYQLTSIQDDGAMYCLPMLLQAEQVVIWGDAQWKPVTSKENYSTYLVEPVVLQSPNADANKLLGGDWENLMAVVDGQIDVVAGNSYSGSEYSGSATLTVDSIYFAGDVLSVRMSAISYAAGQAHPWRGSCVSNILVSTGEDAVLTDLLEPGSDYPTIREGWMKLMQYVNDLDLTQSKKAIVDKAMIGQLGSWSLTPEGLEVGFAPYEISSYKSYSGTTVIPYDQLKGELKSIYFPPAQSENQASPSVELVSGSDERFSAGYMVWGKETDAALAFDGTATHVTISAVNKSDESWDDTVLFYANTLTDALIWLPICESGVYRVRWAVGGTQTTTMIKVP